VTLRGWHYVPDNPPGRVPTIVMSHGFSAVNEMYLDRFAEAFATAGLGSIVFDNRNFGASDGEPRQEIELGDHLTVADQALAAYERALEPKRLVTLPSGHFDAYVAGFEVASGAATRD
jgi:pimeloyl-ACP methyl ester carboxylesterase